MNQNEVNRAVARATGETISTIRNLGSRSKNFPKKLMKIPAASTGITSRTHHITKGEKILMLTFKKQSATTKSNWRIATAEDISSNRQYQRLRKIRSVNRKGGRLQRTRRRS